MPYSSKKELPAAVKKLSSHQQSIFRAAFNSALKQYGTEEKAFKVAWAAVSKYGARRRMAVTPPWHS